jgi:hypothetical protein
MQPLRPFVSASIALLVAIAPAIACAFTTFPGYVQTHLDLTYTPPCTICHQTLAGGAPATLIHPFGQAMLKYGGLTPSSSEAQVGAALDALTAAKVDSDCNHIIDTEQLQQGRDPNFPGEYIDGEAGAPEDPADGGCPNPLQPVLYGCGAQLSPADPSWEGSVAFITGLGTALGLALARRRQVRSRLSGP